MIPFYFKKSYQANYYLLHWHIYFGIFLVGSFLLFFFRFEGLSLRQAHHLVLQQRPFIRPNAGFWRQLMDYERTLFSRNTVRMVNTASGVLPAALQDSDDSTEFWVNVWQKWVLQVEILLLVFSRKRWNLKSSAAQNENPARWVKVLFMW